MQLRKDSDITAISVIDAVDFLSDAAGWSVAAPDQARLKAVFKAVLHYMQVLFSKQRLKDKVVSQGVQAVMTLVREAIDRLEREQGKGFVTDLPEVQNLERFYQQKILPYILKTPLVLEELQKKERLEPDVLQEIQKVRLDKEYELFLIHKEDGGRYFSFSLLHQIQLVAYFDTLFLQFSEEQPFTKIRILADRDCHEAAKRLLASSAPLVDAYYKEALKFKQLGFVSSINKALMALMLTANPRNMSQNTVQKSSVAYYQDFQAYLRQAFCSIEYAKLCADGLERTGHFLHTVLQLSQQLCSGLILQFHSKKEGDALILSLMREGGKDTLTRSATVSPLAFWDRLIDQDANLRSYFSRYPNRPLFKIAQMLESGTGQKGFDPFAQGAFPSQLYRLSSGQLDVSVLRLASPTKQDGIKRAELVQEFLAWVHTLKNQGQHHLLINLQDRTSWREYARCVTLEGALVKDHLSVITLDKWTDFYHQSGSYVQWDDAEEFIKLCKEQVLGDQSGFYFPLDFKTDSFSSFLDSALTMVHSLFFGSKKRLTQKNRTDFIEIFYLLLSLKLVELCHADSVSFTCKDSVDTGAAMNVQLFAFIKMMTAGSSWSKEEADQVLWMLYSSALIQRGRVIDSGCFQRMVSSLEVIGGAIDASSSAVLKGCSNLYEVPFFKEMRELQN